MAQFTHKATRSIAEAYFGGMSRATVLLWMFVVCGAGLLSVSASAQSSDSDLTESLVKESIGDRVRREIGRLEVHQGVTLAEGEIFEGVSAALKYRYELEPSYKGDYHLRMDRWNINVDINAGDLLGDFDMTPVGVGIRKGSEVLFVRPFKSKVDSAVALPYTPARIPFTAERALQKLEVGDFVAFTSQMNVVIGASTSGGTPTLPMSAATHFMVSGEFQVHVFKATQNKLRVKLIAIRRKSVGVSASAGVANDAFKVTGIRIIDKRITKLFDATELFRIQLSKGRSNLLMVDYMMDVSNPQVASAYDGVMNSVYRFKVMGLVNPFTTDTTLTSQLISDVTPIENIFTREKTRSNADRVVDRLFKGKNDIGDQSNTSFRFGLLLFKMGEDTQYVENAMTSVDDKDQEQFFRLHTYERTKLHSAFFNYWKNESISRASILFEADQSLSIRGIRDVMFQWDYRDKNLSGNETKEIQDAVKQNIPPDIYKKINWGVWSDGQDRIGGRVLMTSILHPDAFNGMGGLKKAALMKKLKSYILSIPKPSATTADPFVAVSGGKMPADRSPFHTIVDDYKYDIEQIASLLETVFSSKVKNDKRAEAFGSLRLYQLFIEIGPGFLVSLIPKTDLDRYLYFKLTLTADETPPLNFEYGKVQERKVYDAAAYIQAVLNNRDVDLAMQLAR